MSRDDILTRLGELVGEIETARSAEDIATLSGLVEERDGLRTALRADAPLSVEDMTHELAGLRSHLARFEGQGVEMAIGEDSAEGTLSAIDAIAARQDSSDPHSAPVWIRQRIAFLEERLAKA